MNYIEAKKEFIKTVISYDYKYRKWEIFTDFCQMAAIALYQPFKRSEELEKQYLDIVVKYDKETVNIFPKLLNLVVQGLESKFGDFLGECFMDLDLGSKYKGQFFTPYNISLFMAQILGNNIKDTEFLSNKTCCGSGGMIIARAEALMQQNINYQKTMMVQAVDIDALCVSMAYIQLTLLHIPAEVIHGNSLSNEVFQVWYTPAYIIKAADRQTPNWREEPEENIKIKLPDDEMDNKTIYTDEQLEVFAAGKLFA
jgi:type I restriction-modification system DNA methylase subunit